MNNYSYPVHQFIKSADQLLNMRANFIIITLFNLFYFIHGYAQTDIGVKQEYSDTLFATIAAFGQYRAETQAFPSMHQLRGATLDRYNKTSFLQSLNILPGVRMEERSPGSYRLNMRGSSLRSPFGVRNVKVYFNGLPLTDAGGNTYFNQLAFNNVASIEIAKGPAGSMYGAGTGGLVLVNSLNPRQLGIQAEVSGGSYGLFNLMGSARWLAGDKMQAFAASYTSQDGYRDHTKMHRANASYSGELVKKKNYSLAGHVLLTDLYYQTPGGLTQAEYDANPRQARPKVGTQPSAGEAHAAIDQQNLLAGLGQQWQMQGNWTNETGIYGAYAQVRNPAIRNYEMREEPGWGARSVFKQEIKRKTFTQQWISGAEAQWGDFATKVYVNNNGEKGALLTDDDLDFFTWNAFSQVSRQYGERWDLSAGISYFQNHADIRRNYPAGDNGLKKDFINDWAPRVSVIFRTVASWQFSGLVSRGFSPPTVSELLPSTGELATDLQPEFGWNYEAGIRWKARNERWDMGINYFRFGLNDAIVQRRDSTGGDFYTNAGGTMQQGIEWNGGYLLSRTGSHLQVLSVRSAYTYSHFKYTDYQVLTDDYSGKALPSVPVHTLSVLADFRWRSSFFVQSTLYAASSIWLNDANTAKAKPYRLVGLKAGYGKKVRFWLGVENLFNQTYSLGNDINAFGGRYFNVAPGRNFYAALRLHILPPNRLPIK